MEILAEDESGEYTVFLGSVMTKETYGSYPTFAAEDQIPEGFDLIGYSNRDTAVGTENNYGVVYLKIREFTITWIIDEATYTTTVRYGDSITEPKIEIPEEYLGYRWIDEIPETCPDTDLTIEGVWTVWVNVIGLDGEQLEFTTGGLDYYPQWKLVDVGGTAYLNYRGPSYLEGNTLYLVDIDTDEAYEITYESGMAQYPTVTVTKNTVFVLTTVPKTYTVTLMVNGEQYGETLSVNYGETFVLPVPEEYREGCTLYSFDKWAEEVPETMPGENLVFNAVFTGTLCKSERAPVFPMATGKPTRSFVTVVNTSVTKRTPTMKTMSACVVLLKPSL